MEHYFCIILTIYPIAEKNSYPSTYRKKRNIILHMLFSSLQTPQWSLGKKWESWGTNGFTYTAMDKKRCKVDYSNGHGDTAICGSTFSLLTPNWGSGAAMNLLKTLNVSQSSNQLKIVSKMIKYIMMHIESYLEDRWEKASQHLLSVYHTLLQRAILQQWVAVV